MLTIRGRLITPFVLGSMSVGLNILIRHSFMDLWFWITALVPWPQLLSSSSWGLGRAAVCDCGTPWTFLLPFFHIWRLTCHYLFLISPCFGASGGLFFVTVAFHWCLHLHSFKVLPFSYINYIVDFDFKDNIIIWILGREGLLHLFVHLLVILQRYVIQFIIFSC